MTTYAEHKFRPRTQVRYEDGAGRVEHGFVTGVFADTVYCRFWSNENLRELRTKANSEGCDPDTLTRENFVPSERVDAICDAMGWAL